ncbi:hypothetical protein CH373_02240 [Leptospira perolatii]|uniref:S9 family peptidase n=1 Tax=Leptospira perolatii TaxID=2023191 RepID=A0A2M9ZS33_9LEPT|nr:hypothetical protein [Leptospira perolatii]PJZ71342.1 hypothetical protein CH360_02240 [Leptospira perolatii]PJZ74876.1 hypothetical protein CH373_02240 [Leptospira perolatii]
MFAKGVDFQGKSNFNFRDSVFCRITFFIFLTALPLWTEIFAGNPVQTSSLTLNPIYAVQEDKGILRLISISANSGKSTLLYTGPLEKGIPVFRKNQMILFQTPSELTLLNLLNGQKSILPGSKDAFPGNSGFFRDRPWLVYSRKSGSNTARWETVLFDYEKESELKVLPGNQPFISPDQKNIYLIGNEVKYSEHGEPSLRVPIHKFSIDTQETSTLAWIETESTTERIQVTDVYGINDDYVVVRVSSEKENRYHFLPSTKGELVSLQQSFFPSKKKSDLPKEQFNLSVSHDGKFIAFSERTEGKLGYVVVVDLRNRQRYESSFIGSFPVFRNGFVYFLADPEIVRASKETANKLYNSFTLYELDFRKDKIRTIANLSGKAELLE